MTGILGAAFSLCLLDNPTESCGHVSWSTVPLRASHSACVGWLPKHNRSSLWHSLIVTAYFGLFCKVRVMSEQSHRTLILVGRVGWPTNDHTADDFKGHEATQRQGTMSDEGSW